MNSSKKNNSLRNIRYEIAARSLIRALIVCAAIDVVWMIIEDRPYSSVFKWYLVLSWIPILGYSLFRTLHAIKYGEDKRIYRKRYQDKQLREIEDSKVRHEERKTSRSSWRISCLHYSRKYPEKLQVCLKDLDPTEASLLPTIVINGVACGSEIIPVKRTPHVSVTVFVYPESVLSQNPTHLSVSIEGGDRDNVLMIKNPFFFKKEWLESARIRWQCEGHTDEKFIYVRPIAKDWHPDDDVALSFDLLINRKFFGTFVGTLHTTRSEFVIPIPIIKKVDCRGKPVQLRLTLNKRVRVALPAPIVMTVNYEQV